MKRSAFLGLAFLALSSCQPAVGPISEDDVAAIRSLVADFDQAVLSGDWNRFLGMFTDDAVLMPPNDAMLPMSDFLAWIEPMGYSALEHRIEFVDIDGYGDIAYARGTYSERFTVEGVDEPIEDSGKVLGVLRKQPDGSWLFHIWASSSDLPVTDG
jgi:uncharacterized protein (TIGR02246 family)